MASVHPSRLALIALLALAGVLLAGCAAPAPDTDAPPSIVGAWSRAAGEQTFYLLFLDDAEFRMGTGMDTLFDDPLASGLYEYRDGYLALPQTAVGSASCESVGQYILVDYQPGDPASLRFVRHSDDCSERAALFDNALWTQVAPEG